MPGSSAIPPEHFEPKKGSTGRLIAIALALALNLSPIGGSAQDNQIDRAAVLTEEYQQLAQEGRYRDAIPVARDVLAIREKTLGPDHPDVGLALNNLATVYLDQGRYTEAEPLYKRGLAIREKALGSDDPELASELSNLGMRYVKQARYVEAEALLKRSLAIREKTLGPDDPMLRSASTTSRDFI